jgi:hypothetical protein
MLGVDNMANDAYIPDDFQNEENAQINLEEYELWCLQVELNRINTFMDTLDLGELK